MRTLFLLSLLVVSKVYGQSITIKSLPIFDTLHQKGSVALSTDIGNIYQFFNILENRINNYPHHLEKNKKGLFCLVQATGRVYKLEKASNDSVSIKRIDSTHFYGYNNSAIIFSNNDTLFSFGGNGFWNFNGQLRYFDEKQNEWNVIELKNEIHGSQSLFYVDTKKDILYYVSSSYKDPGIGKIIEGNDVVAVNLNTRDVKILGKVNSKISALFVNPNSMQTCTITPIPSLNSTLFIFDINNKFLISFENNSIKKLTSPKLSNIFYGNSIMIRPRTLFEDNGILYYTKSNDSTFQVFQEKIDLSDFDYVSDKLYVSNKLTIKEFTAYAGITGMILFLLAGYGYFYFFIKHRNAKEFDNKFDPLFSPLEIDLIKQILQKSTKGDKTGCSSDDINHMLGLKKKSLEIQKKARTEAISRINQKYKSQFSTQEDLIVRIRTEEDRRFYRYIVNTENANKVFDLLS